MKIDDINKIKNRATILKKKSNNNSINFASAITEDIDNKETDIKEMDSIPNLNPLFSLQELNTIDNNFEIQEKAKKNARTIINEMKEMQVKLLDNNISLEDIEKLSEQLKNDYGKIQDKKLQQIITDIELRASIEIAKLNKKLK